MLQLLFTLPLKTFQIGMDKAINHLIQPLNSIKSEITVLNYILLIIIRLSENFVSWIVINL